METFRRQRTPLTDRFLGLFAGPPRLSAGAAPPAGDELHEDDVFWNGSEPSSSAPIRHGSPRPVPLAAAGSPYRISRLSSGILAALSEDQKKPQPFLHWQAAAPASPHQAKASPASSARMIPAISKPKLDYSRSMPAGKIFQRSAPVDVPTVPPTVKKWWEELDWDRDEYEMLPPHEIVARARACGEGSPMSTFSVLEGVGRTLKGRDLRRVRNAVLQKTGRYGDVVEDGVFWTIKTEVLSFFSKSLAFPCYM